MLVNLTPDLVELERCRKLVEDNPKDFEGYEYIPQCDPKWLQEVGIYQASLAFNFSDSEFLETIDGYGYNRRNLKEGELEFATLNEDKYVHQYGVADNIEQIKEFYKEQIESTEDKFVISLSPVWQEKENAGKGGGWRWHKWGEYIGDLNPEYEYLDDEDFGDDFEYVLTFHLYWVKP